MVPSPILRGLATPPSTASHSQSVQDKAVRGVPWGWRGSLGYPGGSPGVPGGSPGVPCGPGGSAGDHQVFLFVGASVCCCQPQDGQKRHTEKCIKIQSKPIYDRHVGPESSFLESKPRIPGGSPGDPCGIPGGAKRSRLRTRSF